MTTRPIAPYVLSGGAGTRLWPVSRAGMAKQLVPVLGEDTLLQKTVERLETSETMAITGCVGVLDGGLPAGVVTHVTGNKRCAGRRPTGAAKG